MISRKSPLLPRVVLGVLACLALASCFEPPVRESLLLRFLNNGAVVATSTVELADTGTANQALERRVNEVRRTILEGSDPWGVRFAAAEPAAERFSWEKRLGDLRGASRSAVIAEPRNLAVVFGDTSLSVNYEVDNGRGLAELTIAPGPSARASRKQREEMDRVMETWTTALAEYLQAAQQLYAYLDEHPERAHTCFGTLFAEALPEDDVASLEELTKEEEKVVGRLDEATRQVLEVLTVPDNGAHSPDEVSHLVYDPFPARLTVKLPGTPLSVEGFRRGEKGALSVPSLGLWEALKSLEGRWLAPDPVLFYVASVQSESEQVDLDLFVQQARKSAPAHLLPSADEVRAAVEEGLRPAPVYRAAWRIQPDDDTPFRWDDGEGQP
jgi:hypothetical protein